MCDRPVTLREAALADKRCRPWTQRAMAGTRPGRPATRLEPITPTPGQRHPRSVRPGAERSSGPVKPGKAKARQRHALNRALKATLCKLRSEETVHGAEAP